MIQRFEEISNNAWPALSTMQYDGWILRFASGVTKRSNSVSMLYPSTLPPKEKLAFCESIFGLYGITPCFKVTAMATPAGIDQLLANAGYFIHSHVLFMTMDISNSPDLKNIEFTLTNHPTEGWIDDFISMNGFDPARQPVYEAIMDRLQLKKGLISVMYENKRVAIGLGVVEGAYIGLFDLVVHPAFRRRGLGKQVVDGLLAWGRSEGASLAYLQVLSDNDPAISLYLKEGFTEMYRYWYRMKR